MRWLGTELERSVRQSMMDSLPRLYNNSKVVNEIIRVDSDEMEEYYKLVNEVLDQFFVNTATWGLDLWESQLGLTSTPLDSIGIRRARIISRLNNNNTFNVDSAINLANLFSLSGKGATFTEYPKTYEFKTVHNIDDITDTKDLIAAFDEVKPAHLRHIVGLIIHQIIGPKVTQKSFIEQSIIQPFSFETDILHKYKYRASMIGFGRWYDTESSYTLFNNDAWTLDGTFKLDGKNTKGVDLYNRQADLIFFKAVQYAVMSIAHEIQLKKTSMKQWLGYDSSPVHNKYEFIKDKGKMIGQGSEIGYVPNYDELLCNSAWSLDGTQVLDGKNPAGFQLYLTAPAVLKTYKSGVLVKQEFIN